MKSKTPILIISLVFIVCQFAFAELPQKFQDLIQRGEFTKCQQLMRRELAENLEIYGCDRLELVFEIERLERIKKDFPNTIDAMLPGIKRYIPEVDSKMIDTWEQNCALEFMRIDGKKFYFVEAVPNLFRIDRNARKRRQMVLEGNSDAKPADEMPFSFEQYIEQLLQVAAKTHGHFLSPKRFRISYTLTVKKDVVPPGKVIRCWLPFPRFRAGHQTAIRLISTKPERRIIAPNHFLQRTVYLEKTAKPAQPTRFQVFFHYTSHAIYRNIQPEDIEPYRMDDALSPFVYEREPHIIFSDDLIAQSDKIVNGETNPYLIAKKLFAWVDGNIPWASAREYSTIRNISGYAFRNSHGDCGIQTLLFITLCRMNGIPAKWQSGWTTEPESAGMHDWGEIYFEPFGWLPVDVSYGLRQSENPEVRWFYFGNLDVYRLVVNDDYSQPLYPAKIHPRSETVDFQLGEVEWEGGNLYFDQWDYEFSVQYLD
ncbi:transglutaminase domain-containing protein [candidate division KSB1 bacterium]|nr:transglutaminase domain-containing protein [candidate division KSB1 bacterium]